MSRARASTSTAAARRRWPRLASSASSSVALDHAPPRSRNPLSKDRAPSDRQIDGLHPPAARRRRPRRKDNSLARCFARSNSPLHRFSRKRRTRAPATPLHAKEVDCRPALRVNFRPALTRSASGSNKAMHSFTRQSYARLLLASICNQRGRSRDSVRHAGSSRTMAGKHSPTADPIARNLGQTERREFFAVPSLGGSLPGRRRALDDGPPVPSRECGGGPKQEPDQAGRPRASRWVFAPGASHG